MDSYQLYQLSEISSHLDKIPKEHSPVFAEVYLQNKLDGDVLLPFPKIKPEKGKVVWLCGDVGNNVQQSALQLAQAAIATKSYAGFAYVNFATNHKSSAVKRNQILHSLDRTIGMKFEHGVIDAIQYDAAQQAKSIIDGLFDRWNEIFDSIRKTTPVTLAKLAADVKQRDQLYLIENPRKLAYLDIEKVLELNGAVLVANNNSHLFELGSRNHFDYFDNERCAAAARKIFANTAAIIENRRVFIKGYPTPIVLQRQHEITDGQAAAMKVRENSIASIMLDIHRSMPSWETVASGVAKDLGLVGEAVDSIVAAAKRLDNAEGKIRVKIQKTQQEKDARGLTMKNYAQAVIKLFESDPDEVIDSYAQFFNDRLRASATNRDTVKEYANLDYSLNVSSGDFIFPEIAYKLERTEKAPILKTFTTQNWPTRSQDEYPRNRKSVEVIKTHTTQVDNSIFNDVAKASTRPKLSLKKPSMN